MFFVIFYSLKSINLNQIIQSIEDNKLIAIVRGVSREKLIPLAEALYEGGIRLLEVT